jgi:hypothetical protein
MNIGDLVLRHAFQIFGHEMLNINTTTTVENYDLPARDCTRRKPSRLGLPGAASKNILAGPRIDAGESLGFLH